MSKININTIISGTVGSGRNYLSMIYALAIIDGKPIEDILKEPSDKLKKRANELSDEGQIFNISLNENLRYEDFVEGFLGVDPTGNVVFSNGIIKQIAMLAKQNMIGCFMEQLPKQEFEITFNQLYKAFLDEISKEQISYMTTGTGKKYMVHRVEQRGNFYVRGENSYSTYYISRAELKKVFEKGPEYLNMKFEPKYEAKMKEATGAALNPEPYEAVYNTLISFRQKYIDELVQKKHMDLTETDNFDFSQFPEEIANCCKKYVLIIEHMDIDNASKIFGDTLGLLEENKRAGKPEEAFIYLPFSKASFSLPPNLYIVGMIGNEENHSNAGNLALLNNFEIIHVEQSISDVWPKEADSIIEGIDLIKLVEKINHRMEILLPRTFTINPYVFKSVKTLDELRDKFSKRIIPQLERAFSGDLSKLRLVIGKDFIGEKIIYPELDFMDFEYGKFKVPEKEFLITKPEKWSSDSFRRIYS